MFKLYFPLLLILFCSTLSSQENSYDEWLSNKDTITSNESLINYSKSFIKRASGEERAKILLDIAKTYAYGAQKDSVLKYFDEAEKIIKSLNSKDYLTTIYSTKADYFLNLDDLNEAEKSISKATLYHKKNTDTENSIEYYGTLSRYKGVKGDSEASYKYMNKSIELATKIKDSTNLPNLYHNLGLQYYNDSKFEEATASFLKALELKNQYKAKDKDVTYYMLGYGYLENENHDLAIKYFSKAIEHSKKTENAYLLLYSNTKIAKAYIGKNMLDEGIKYLDSSKLIAKEINVPDRIAQIDLEIGLFYLYKKENYDKAETYLNDAYRVAKNSNIPHIKTNTLKALFEIHFQKQDFNTANRFLQVFDNEVNNKNIITFEDKKNINLFKGQYYKATKNYKKSLDNYLMYYKLKDSVSSTESKNALVELEKKYDTKNKELQISELSKENQVKELQNQKAKTKQYIYLSLAMLFGLLLLTGFWIYNKLRKQKRELAKTNNKLNETNNIKNRLFSIISHDLRGMLVPFQRSGKVLGHYVEKEEYKKVKKLSNEIQSNSNNLSNLLDNLLNWSLEQMNGYTFKSEEFSIKEEFETIIKNFKQHCLEKQTKIELDYTEDYTITFDKGAFHVIFRNLLNNALKYTEQGTIKISFAKEFNTVTFALIDTGIGMSQEQLQHLFTLKENAESTLGTQGEKGTGLGLNLVHRFVKMHKGTIKVSSKLRLGTRFDLSFPINAKQINTFDNISA